MCAVTGGSLASSRRMDGAGWRPSLTSTNSSVGEPGRMATHVIDEPQTPQPPEATPHKAPHQANEKRCANPVRVVLADSQSIYRVGIRKILAVEDDLRVVGQAENYAQALSAATRHATDVLLLE